MSILGDVETGWFASVAHGCRAVSRTVLNGVSCGQQWGDRLYSSIEAAAEGHVGGINEQTIHEAAAQGATLQQALAAGSAALEKVAQPSDVVDVATLAAHGTGVIGRMLSDAAFPAQSSMDVLGSLAPLLIGAAVLSGSYLVSDTLSKS